MLNFGFHLLMGAAALCAGLFIIVAEGEILPGMALCGAALFASVNGINGFHELISTKKRSGYLRDN
jgi:hypothetical protein